MKERGLSARQREVLRLVASGRTAVQIGRVLCIEHTTVNRHLADMYRILGAQDRAHAVALAIWRGDITLADLAAIGTRASARSPEAPPEALSARHSAADGSADGSGEARESRDAPRAPQGRSDDSRKAAA